MEQTKPKLYKLHRACATLLWFFGGSSEKVYAWLPLQSYGLRFIVQAPQRKDSQVAKSLLLSSSALRCGQADWKVPSSREAITDNVFNQKLGVERTKDARRCILCWVCSSSPGEFESKCQQHL